MDVQDVSMRWATRRSVLNGMNEWVAMVNDAPRLRMVSRHMGHVAWEPRWQDEMQCCIERPSTQVETRASRMTWPSVQASGCVETSKNACAGGVYGRTNLDSVQIILGWRRYECMSTYQSHRIGSHLPLELSSSQVCFSLLW